MEQPLSGNDLIATSPAHWEIVSDKISSDGHHRSVHCRLWIDFEPSQWNKATQSPVLEMKYMDHFDRLEKTWSDGNLYVITPYQRAEVYYNYFMRCPHLKLYASDMYKQWSGLAYGDLSLGDAMEKAVELLRERLLHSLACLPSSR